ncbi:alpha/beta hydrolase family protein [Nonomuraea sp. NPDC050328]|uniref:alpha/beta hydrolase family protein n=1 Tax=Nonomuraea sp. NPDC050328 TaxID=3364361 RepID=UPI0037A66801
MTLTGTAAGVPYLAVPPATPNPDAPVVLAWHLLDSPRTPAALAAALPLDGLDAWRVYLGLPMTGDRLPEGGWPEVIRLASEDAVRNMHRPVVYGGAEEFAAAWPELKQALQVEPRSLGVVGGSMGAAVAQLVALESGLDIEAAVLVSPVVQLRAAVAAVGRRYGIAYPWTAETDAVAERLDFVARAAEFGPTQVLLVVGEEDDREGFLDPSAALAEALGGRGRLATIPDMGHALADEPGTDPAPQTPHAAAVDRLATGWLRERL